MKKLNNRAFKYHSYRVNIHDIHRTLNFNKILFRYIEEIAVYNKQVNALKQTKNRCCFFFFFFGKCSPILYYSNYCVWLKIDVKTF